MKRSGLSSLIRMAGVAMVFGVCLEASAGPISWLARSPLWPWGWPDTLIVTGNYAEPRLLAEVAQFKTKQPLIIISPEADGDHIYYMPYKQKEAMELSQAEYTEFIETMLRPKRIVFLGGEEMIPGNYVETVKKNYTSLVLKGEDWERNAKQLGKVMHCWTLKHSFRKARRKVMEAKAHREVYDPQGETILLPETE